MRHLNQIFKFSFLLFITPYAFGDTSSSMVIFQQPGKETIVINESGQSQLAKIFNSFSKPDALEFMWSSQGDSLSDIIVQCKHVVAAAPINDAYSCTFKFSQSIHVSIDGKNMTSALGDVQSRLLVETHFVSSTGATFDFKVMEQGISAISQNI